MRPYRAKPMASTRLDLPEPVGPVKANRSAPSNSTTVRSRKAVKPSTSSRLGRTGLLQQLRKQPGDAGIVDGPLGQVVGEQVVGRASGPVAAVAGGRPRPAGRVRR